MASNDDGDGDSDLEQTNDHSRPTGTKKQKLIEGERKKESGKNDKLVEAATALAFASKEKAQAIERAANMQLFSIALDGLDEESKKYIMWQRRQIIQKSGMNGNDQWTQ